MLDNTTWLTDYVYILYLKRNKELSTLVLYVVKAHIYALDNGALSFTDYIRIWIRIAWICVLIIFIFELKKLLARMSMNVYVCIFVYG